MKISVIISTYNSPKWLEKVLWGYACQSLKGFEIVIADDGSGDKTKKLINQFRNEAGFLIRHVWHEDKGFRKWNIVNKAIAEATGSYLIFTDGDCVQVGQLIMCYNTKKVLPFFAFFLTYQTFINPEGIISRKILTEGLQI